MTHSSSWCKAVFTLICGILLFAACQSGETPLDEPTVTQLPAVVAVTETQVPTPTVAPVPAAAVINGEVIPLTYFENEVKRYKASFAEGEALPAEAEMNQTVLDYLIDQMLLAQAARQNGYTVTDEILEERIASLVEQLGSGGSLTNWMESNFYNDAEFRYTLKLSTEAAWQRDQIIASVPNEVEQVRARQIFAQTDAGAQRALSSLKSGTSFDDLAWEFSPETGGELGWFPRGYLLYPQIEEAAFSLAVGQYSEIIQSDIGYHIILVMEHEDAHPLTTDAKISLQSQNLAQWLVEQRGQATIETTLP